MGMLIHLPEIQVNAHRRDPWHFKRELHPGRRLVVAYKRQNGKGQ
jgi:hypothetical protein